MKYYIKNNIKKNYDLKSKSLLKTILLFTLIFSQACSIFDNKQVNNKQVAQTSDAQNLQNLEQNAGQNNTYDNIYDDSSYGETNPYKGEKDFTSRKEWQANGVLGNAQSSTSLLISDVEVLWLIPNQEVEGFILSYGFDENNLNNKVQILTSELEVVSDPIYNRVYRYVLKNIPKDKKLFIQLTSFNNNEFSLPSKVFTLRVN
ncbi:MAG: hypothetical protein ACOX3T_07560 [Bdellovibrionota bacterium]